MHIKFSKINNLFLKSTNLNKRGVPMDFMKMLDKCTGEELLQRHIDMDRANKEQSYFCGTVEQCGVC